MKKLPVLSLLFLLMSVCSYAQVGIGTTTPDPSSMLDITSDSQGLLAPRMTTTQRTAITNPADGLLVFDTDETAFYYYDMAGIRWVKLLANNVERDNYKLVKSAADLAPELVAGGNSKYLLDEDTYYEINGTIVLAAPIDLNNAYLSGLDANEDVLVSSGTVFAGSMGGAIRNVTITGGASPNGTAFNITGGNLLLIQNCIIANMTSVGTISNVGTYFTNIIQFVNNNGGITYSDIDNLLLLNQAWVGNNKGIYETLKGEFTLIQKVSGFSQVIGAAAGVDITGVTNVLGDAVMESVVFSGGGNYINGSSPYTGYNFTNDWTVDSPGIPRESDDVATGNLYFNSSSVVGLSNTNPFKLPVNTDAIRLFRTAEGTGVNSENRIVYKGQKGRSLNVFAAVSFTATAGTRLGFSIYKNGVQVVGTQTVVDVLVTDARQSVSILGTVDVETDDYIEIYGRKISAANEQFLVTSYNLIVN